MYGGYGSEFEDERGTKRKSASWKNDQDLVGNSKRSSQHGSKLPDKTLFTNEYEREERRSHMFHFLSMDAYSRHRKLVHDYLHYYGGKMEDFKRSTENDKTDHDVIRENHKFLWKDTDAEDTWGQQLAKKYYDKLFKEYCIADVSRYKENKFAMRWRIEKEVVDGKGQFICGAKRCEDKIGLKSWEVNFAYMEEGMKKNALVKLRLCADCSFKLNYHHQRKEIKKKKSAHKKSKKKKHKHSKKKKRKARKSSPSDSSESSTDSSDNDDGSQPTLNTSLVTEGHVKETEKDEDIWKKPAPVIEEKSREEEFEEYLADLFM